MSNPPSSISLKTPLKVVGPHVKIEANHILHVSCTGSNGKAHNAAIDLNSVLGNANGALSLGGTGFASKTEGVEIKQISKYRHAIDAKIPDVNGHHSTSSLILKAKVGAVDGRHKLLMSWHVPHSKAHADSKSTHEADTKVKSQIKVLTPGVHIDHVLTLSLAPKYHLNNPNLEWVKKNLGPHGSSDSTEWGQGGVEAGTEAGGEGVRMGVTAAVDSIGECVVM